jgi:prevent-host-death family protein
MSEVTIRQLRNHGGDVVDRVAAGEHVTITRGGRAVARLEPLARPALSAEALLERWARVPQVDPARFRADIDAVLDPTL